MAATGLRRTDGNHPPFVPTPLSPLLARERSAPTTTLQPSYLGVGRRRTSGLRPDLGESLAVARSIGVVDQCAARRSGGQSSATMHAISGSTSCGSN